MRRALPVALVLLFLPASAMAGTLTTILEDCTDNGRLDGTYSRADLRHARHNMTTEIAEYTDCGDILRRAELREAEGGGSGEVSGPAVSPQAERPLLQPVDDAERGLLAQAREQGDRPVAIAGERVVPGATGLQVAAARNTPPTGFLVTALALTLLLAGGAVRRVLRGGDQPAMR